MYEKASSELLEAALIWSRESSNVSDLSSQQKKNLNRYPDLEASLSIVKPKRLRKNMSSYARRAIRIRAMDKVCRYCLIGPAESVDHVIPRSKGGSSRELNLVGCCHSCNSKKKDLLPKEAGMKLHLPPRFFLFEVVDSI